MNRARDEDICGGNSEAGYYMVSRSLFPSLGPFNLCDAGQWDKGDEPPHSCSTPPFLSNFPLLTFPLTSHLSLFSVIHNPVFRKELITKLNTGRTQDMAHPPRTRGNHRRGSAPFSFLFPHFSISISISILVSLVISYATRGESRWVVGRKGSVTSPFPARAR